MSKLQKMQPSEHSTLTQVLFGQSSPTPMSPDDLNAEIPWKDSSLNEGQKEAIRFALASREVALIHGKNLLDMMPVTTIRASYPISDILLRM